MRAALWSLVASSAATLVAAAPPFVLQDARPTTPSPQPARPLADLSPSDFHAVQDALRESLEHFVDEGKRLVQDTFDAFEDDLAKTQDDGIHPPHPPSHPLPPPVIDMSKYTILEIVNQSFHRHQEHEDGEVRLVDRTLREGLAARRPCKHARTLGGEHGGDDHDHELPLHRLAWLVNFSPDAAKLLEKDGITLLAPDDMALTPPHRRGGGDHHGFAGQPERSVEDMFAATLSERSHPFHSHEFSPEKLAKLAASTDGDDEDKEEKKRIFRKIIAVVGAYHVIPESQNSHDLVDRSTVPTLLDESRVRVSPGFETFPFPHPTLKFNVYSHKRGPTVIAKNGIIHLVSAPLFPPWTVLNELFVFPGAFAGLTNAIQKVGLDEPLLPPNDADTKLPEDFVGSPFVRGIVEELAAEKGLDSFTVFAPSNAAFARLGWKINGFLHSPLPFAKKVLKYLLSYHVVPGLRFYSDFLHNDSSIASEYVVKEEIDVEVPLEWVTEGHGEVFHPSDWSLPPFPGRRPSDEHPHPPPHVPERPHPGPRANITHYVLPTLLTEHNPNATLKIGVVSYRSFFGKGPIRRNVIVFPSHGGHHGHHAAEKEEEEVRRVWGNEGGDDHGRIPRPHPVKVAFTDVPARAGAIQVLGHDFLLPPPPPHKYHDHDHEHSDDLVSLAQNEARRLAKAVHKLFA